MNTEARQIIGDAVRPVFEDVEQRRMMSAASLEDHVLTIATGDGDDQIELQLNEDASELTATVNGEEAGTFAANTVYVINVDAGDGDNAVVLDPRIGSTTGIRTGSGRDVIYGGSGPDRIDSGGGRDVIDARGGNDSIYAGSGNDKINGGSGNDSINAGSGNDSIHAGGGTDKLLGRKGNDKFYADADDYVQTDGGRNEVNRSQAPLTRDDTYTPPKVRSLAIVDADTGRVVEGYGKITADTTIDPANLPTRYTVVAHVDDEAKSVYFNAVGSSSLWRRDSDGAFSMTADKTEGGKYTAWQPKAGETYTIKVAANTASDLAGLTGEVFQIKLTLKKAATGAGVPTTPTAPTTPATPTTPTAPTTPANDAAAPRIKMNVTTENIVAGHGFHAEATQTVIPGHQAEDARFEWDFGDASGKYNKLAGFNAAHVYERAGDYTLTLTVTAPGGKVSRLTRVVSVKAASTTAIYVAANGNDDNEGGSQDKAVRTLGRAIQLATDNTRILMRRGDTFDVLTTASIENDNVAIDTYGVGNSPVIRYVGARTPMSMVRVESTAQNVLINGITFTTIYDDDTEQAGMAHAIQNAGHNVTIRGNTFLHVGYGINNNGNPNGVYVVDNKAPLEDGVRGYFCWTQGTNLVIVGNQAQNSTREHVIRASRAFNVAIAHNDFTNMDRRTTAGDTPDYAKTTINVQRGAYVYVANNTVHDGTISMGPLGGADGANEKDARFEHGVIENNTVDNASVHIQHGAVGVTIRDNRIELDDADGITVHGYDAGYNRTAKDVVIDHNVMVNDGTQGRFLSLDGRSEQAVLTNNVYVAPNIVPGPYATAAVSVAEGNLSSFRTVNGNIWPSARNAASSAAGALQLVGGEYVTASEWNAIGQVGTDRSEDVSASNASNVTKSMLKAA